VLFLLALNGPAAIVCVRSERFPLIIGCVAVSQHARTDDEFSNRLVGNSVDALCLLRFRKHKAPGGK
jgi:hypothetical protein